MTDNDVILLQFNATDQRQHLYCGVYILKQKIGYRVKETLSNQALSQRQTSTHVCQNGLFVQTVSLLAYLQTA